MTPPSPDINVTLNELQWELVLKALRAAVAGQEELMRLCAKHRTDMSDPEYTELHTSLNDRKIAFEQILDTLKDGLARSSSRVPFHVA